MNSKFLAVVGLTSFLFSVSSSPSLAKKEAKKLEPPNTVARLKSKLEKSPNNIRLREQIGRSLYKEKHYADVIQVLEPYSVELTPPSRWMLIMSYKALKDSKAQIRHLKELIEADGKNTSYLHELARAFFSDGQETEAVETYRKIIKINNKDERAYSALLDIFENNKNNYEATTLLTAMKTHLGNQPLVYNGLCRRYSLGGFLPQAVQACQKAISLNPDVAANHMYLAQTYRDQGHEQIAARIYSKAGGRFKADLPLQLAAGDYFTSKEKFAISGRFYQNAVTAGDKTGAAHFGLAQALFETAQYKKALPQLIAACRIDKTKEREFRSFAAKLLKANPTLAAKYQKSLYKCHTQ